MYASNGYTVLSILRGEQARILVPSGAISPWMKHAIVAAEDKRFYEHRGVDLRGMARALYADVSNHGAVQGGSTITQQFVKNAYLTSQKSVGRKLFEAALAWQLEQRWTKDRILTAYLNTVYFGNGAYGVEQASRIYFHHRAARSTPRSPPCSRRSPGPELLGPGRPPAGRPRSPRPRAAPPARAGLPDPEPVRQVACVPMPDPKDVSLPSTQGVAAPYFANYVKEQLVNHYGPARTFGGGLKVTTTLNVGMQKMARDAIQSVLPQNGTGPTAAVVVLDAQNGAVLAMVGGENYHRNQFNLATQGERQPGSSFKPFVLATALRQNIAPSSVLNSAPVTINADGRLWKVNNYEGEYLGRINLTQAIAVLGQLGLLAADGARRPAQRARHGARARDHDEAERLLRDRSRRRAGDAARDGPRLRELRRRRLPRRRIDLRRPAAGDHEDPGLEGARDDQRGRCEAGAHADQAETVNQLLQGVVQYGTGKAAQLPGRQVAGKTGTTENYGDAWFVGYTPQYVTAVWVGYPDKLVPMTTEFHGKPVAGGTFPALIWKAFMQKALAKLPPETSRRPTTATRRRSPSSTAAAILERDDGVCRNTAQLEFFGGEVLATAATGARRRRARRTRSRSRTRSACRSPTRGRGSRASR